MYREWKKIRFPNIVLYMNLETTRLGIDQEIDGKVKWGRMEYWLVEKGGRKEYITERNGRGC